MPDFGYKHASAHVKVENRNSYLQHRNSTNGENNQKKESTITYINRGFASRRAEQKKSKKK